MSEVLGFLGGLGEEKRCEFQEERENADVFE